jgi:uncharacterized protein (DUF1778 family)
MEYSEIIGDFVMLSSSSPQTRLQMRLDPATKALLERAADYMHESLTQFVLEHAVAAANQVIAEHEQKITLQEKDWEVFFAALTNPPEPNAALQKAFQDYQRRNLTA